MTKISVPRFQKISGLNVLDTGSEPGKVDKNDKFYEVRESGLQEVSFADAVSRYEALAPGTETPVVAGATAGALKNDQLLFCQDKSPERILSDFKGRLERYDVVIGTKANRMQFEALRDDPSTKGKRVAFDETSQVLTVEKGDLPRLGMVVVAAAGPQDLAVAEEAARIADAMGNKVERLYDFDGTDPAQAKKRENLLKLASAVIAVSGEDADLPNQIAAVTGKPVIAAPTSARFGEGLEGTQNLMDMMEGSRDNVSVVNTDNGFGAAYVADKINRQSVAAASVAPWQSRLKGGRGLVVVTTAGSADIPVAEAAAQEAERLGDKVLRLYDRGVNDPEAVEKSREAFKRAKAVIVAAGLEGGLPNGVAALTQSPVIAVPTSVGYGTGKGGVAALMCALNACSPGITVVPIDDASHAAAVAHGINEQS